TASHGHTRCGCANINEVSGRAHDQCTKFCASVREQSKAKAERDWLYVRGPFHRQRDRAAFLFGRRRSGVVVVQDGDSKSPSKRKSRVLWRQESAAGDREAVSRFSWRPVCKVCDCARPHEFARGSRRSFTTSSQQNQKEAAPARARSDTRNHKG